MFVQRWWVRLSVHGKIFRRAIAFSRGACLSRGGGCAFQYMGRFFGGRLPSLAVHVCPEVGGAPFSTWEDFSEGDCLLSRCMFVQRWGVRLSVHGKIFRRAIAFSRGACLSRG